MLGPCLRSIFGLEMAVDGHSWVSSWNHCAGALLQAPVGNTGPSSDPEGYTAGGCRGDVLGLADLSRTLRVLLTT